MVPWPLVATGPVPSTSKYQNPRIPCSRGHTGAHSREPACPWFIFPRADGFKGCPGVTGKVRTVNENYCTGNLLKKAGFYLSYCNRGQKLQYRTELNTTLTPKGEEDGRFTCSGPE